MAPIWPENFSELCSMRCAVSGRQHRRSAHVEEGLKNIIYKASRAASSADELFYARQIKTQHQARLKRICMCACAV
jgi:hypothetical protein